MLKTHCGNSTSNDESIIEYRFFTIDVGVNNSKLTMSDAEWFQRVTKRKPAGKTSHHITCKIRYTIVTPSLHCEKSEIIKQVAGESRLTIFCQAVLRIIGLMGNPMDSEILET